MKRAIASFAAALVYLMAAAGSAAIAKPNEDLVSGTGQGLFGTEFGAFPNHSHVNAKGDETDARGHGWARVDTPIGEVVVTASVFCVNVDGNAATIGLIVDESNFFAPGTGRLRKVIDNGQGSQDPPDQAGVTSFLPPPATCPPPALTPIPTGPVDQGNFVVKDGG